MENNQEDLGLHIGPERIRKWFKLQVFLPLFIAGMMFLLYAMFKMHHFSIRTLRVLIPDLIDLVQEMAESFIFDYGFRFGFQPYAFLNFLLSRILFRAFLPSIFILMFFAGLCHRKGKKKGERLLTIVALVVSAGVLFLRFFSDYSYRLSYSNSRFNDDEIYHKLSYLVFGEQLTSNGVTAFYCIVLGFVVIVIGLTLWIQIRRDRWEYIDYRWYFLACGVFAFLSFFLSRLTGRYFQSFVLCLSIASLSMMSFIGTGLIRKKKKEKKKKAKQEQAPAAALPEGKKEEPEVQETATQENAEPEPVAENAPEEVREEPIGTEPENVTG